VYSLVAWFESQVKMHHHRLLHLLWYPCSSLSINISCLQSVCDRCWKRSFSYGVHHQCRLIILIWVSSISWIRILMAKLLKMRYPNLHQQSSSFISNDVLMLMSSCWNLPIYVPPNRVNIEIMNFNRVWKDWDSCKCGVIVYSMVMGSLKHGITCHLSFCSVLCVNHKST
jgi:hypothetical protein